MKRFLPLLFFLFTTLANAQQNLQGWHLLDAKSDHINGISLNQAYELLKDKSSKPVIVAVIDGGVDTTHEDLKNILWKNPKEIAGNGVDDDGNGYIDDIYGWNFLGGKDGRNVSTTSREVGRIYHGYKNKFYKKAVNAESLSAEEKEQYNLWKKAAELVEVSPEEQNEIIFFESTYKVEKRNEKLLKAEMKKEVFTIEEVEKFVPATPPAKQAKYEFLTFTKNVEKSETNTTIFADFLSDINDKKTALKQKYVAPSDDRSPIVKDNYTNINDRFYGNNDVMGPSPLHGTHVCGIIAAERGNNKGIDGIANNVRLMIIRAVPDGDEYDKDIALAIRYAVDNGAKVINMSFGKEISPEKKWVDEAVRYAEQKDVLLIHAAGNEAADNDSITNYPNPDLTTLHTKASNFITVGASGDLSVNGDYVADFSNYGKNSVDVFAPGVKIYSTIPCGNTYTFEQGTSMAAPVVSGVAALIRCYFPGLSAKQVKYVIEKSVDASDSSLQVTKPGTANEKVSFSTLCFSGGWINAYNAIEVAATLTPEKNENERKEKSKESLPVSTLNNSLIKQ